MKVIDFEPGHVLLIQEHTERPYKVGEFTLEHGVMFKNSGPAYTVIDDGGNVMMICGRADAWDGFGAMWGALSWRTKGHMVALTRITRRIMDMLQVRRLEFYTRSDYPASQRWAEMLGFIWSHHAAKFFADGADAEIYVRLGQ